jgi:von Willebrand factor type A domain
MENRARRLRRLFSLAPPGRRDLVLVVAALVLLPALLGVAAAQPVVVHRQNLTERIDAQVFIVLDTSLSMSARNGPHGPTRLDLAEREARSLIPQLGDIPVGLATMTDRVLPNVMPTTNTGLVLETLDQSIGIDQPPPSQHYPERATQFQALFPIVNDHLFAPEVKHPILVVMTDGEATPLPRGNLGYDLAQQLSVPPLFVHVWSPNDRIYVNGRVDRAYRPDPQSSQALAQFARDTHGRVFAYGDVGSLLSAIRGEAGTKPAQTLVLGYARVALGQWFLLAGVVPLGFLFWRRNV